VRHEGSAPELVGGGRCAHLSANAETADHQPSAGIDLSDLAGAVASLGSPFVTVDLAKTTAGDRRVVEVGDGQVSDRPASLPASSLLESLSARAESEPDERPSR
jgi:hypothetical protein